MYHRQLEQILSSRSSSGGSVARQEDQEQGQERKNAGIVDRIHLKFVSNLFLRESPSSRSSSYLSKRGGKKKKNNNNVISFLIMDQRFCVRFTWTFRRIINSWIFNFHNFCSTWLLRQEIDVSKIIFYSFLRIIASLNIATRKEVHLRIDSQER